jgi:hypothetical protein
MRGTERKVTTQVSSSEPSNETDIIPYKKTLNNWRLPLVKYMTYKKFKIETDTQRNQREVIREIEIFMLEKKYFEILEKME